MDSRDFYEELMNNRDSLFSSFDKRIEEREAVLTRSDEELYERTELVAEEILKMVNGILYSADTDGEYIEEVNPVLGLTGPSVKGEKTSQYTIDRDGLDICLNYSRTKYGNKKRVRSFADTVDWNYLKDILGAYGIEIDREYNEEDIKGFIVYIEQINIKANKEKNKITGFSSHGVKIDSDLYSNLWTNRDSLFNGIYDRIEARKEREIREQQVREEWERYEKRKTDKVLKDILSLVMKIFNEADAKAEDIEDLDGFTELGVLGNKLGGSERSHFTVDENGLTISLNYSKNRDEDSYSICFGDFVNWDYLKQSLLEYGIEISRDSYDRNANREQKYHHFDVITIRVSRLTKNHNIRYGY